MLECTLPTTCSGDVSLGGKIKTGSCLKTPVLVCSRSEILDHAQTGTLRSEAAQGLAMLRPASGSNKAILRAVNPISFAGSSPDSRPVRASRRSGAATIKAVGGIIVSDAFLCWASTRGLAGSPERWVFRLDLQCGFCEARGRAPDSSCWKLRIDST